MLVISFFMTDKVKDIEKQVEQLRISMLQDRYLMQNKMKVLEEELIGEPVDLNHYKKDR